MREFFNKNKHKINNFATMLFLYCLLCLIIIFVTRWLPNEIIRATLAVTIPLALFERRINQAILRLFDGFF